MRLSYIVPVYKPKYDIFEKHLKALSAQALTEWDAIYVLDGPDARAKNLINLHIPNASIKEIPHSGAQAARNEGGKHASGDFLCFLDCDCILEPGASKMWVEQFDKHPEAGFIYSGYKFIGDKYAIDSESWDPWTMRIRNYVSGCFPLRRSLYPGWTDGLKSLQDWDMWLSLMEKAEGLGYDLNKLGRFIPGYAFSTAMPDPESISGKGCLPEVWLDRMDAVKTLHRLPDRKICVSSIGYRHDAIALAKLIDADFVADPSDKPHRYKTVIQVGFGMGKNAEKHAAIFGDKTVKKILFWTGDNINEIYHGTSFRQIDAMSQLLNEVSKQFCEDAEAQRLLKRAGFEAEILSMPIGVPNVLPMPEKKKWVVDIAGDYSPVISVVAQSLPDIQLDMVGPATKLSEYAGLIHFFPDRSISNTIKRAQLTGRHVISNVDAPHCVKLDDKTDVEKFIVDMVAQVRELTGKEADPLAAKAYASEKERLMEVAA